MNICIFFKIYYFFIYEKCFIYFKKILINFKTYIKIEIKKKTFLN